MAGPKNKQKPGFDKIPASPQAGTKPAGGLLLVGKFGGAQGVRGEIRIRSFTQDPMMLASYRNLLDASGTRTFVIKKARLAKEGVLIAQIDGVNDRTAAETLTNIDLFIRRDDLPEPQEDEFYVADLIGLEAKLVDGTYFGAVTRVDNFGAGDILTITKADASIVDLIFDKNTVPTVDLAGGAITVNLPDEIEVRDEDFDAPQ